MKCEVKSKLESQENDMNAIERKNSAYSRPMLASSAVEQDPHNAAFGGYLLSDNATAPTAKLLKLSNAANANIQNVQRL